MSHVANAEIETIVGLVVERLLAKPEATLHLSGSVISVREIEGRLDGVRLLRVSDRAIITPAARDELAKHCVTIERVSQIQELSPVSVSRVDQLVCNIQILVIFPEAKSLVFRSMATDCSYYPVPAGQDSNQTFRDVVQNWRAQQYGIWYTSQPYAACAAVRNQSDLTIRAIGLVDLAELNAAVEQASPNLLILDEKRWTTHQLTRLIRAWRKLVKPS